MNRFLFHKIFAPVDDVDMMLNDPFDYQLHPLVLSAAKQIEMELQRLGSNDNTVREELSRGKMLGVLVVRAECGEVGFLAGFSGMLGGKTVVDYFVPPIYDLNREYYRAEEQAISELSSRIEQLRRNPDYVALREEQRRLQIEAEESIANYRAEAAAAKGLRAERRLSAPNDEALLVTLQRESQHEKAELKRMQSYFREQQHSIEGRLNGWQSQISQLETERAEASQQLQRRIFESYILVNGRGEWRSIYTIFDDQFHCLPPAGTGECAAPKLLHYALCNNLQPIAMGEFWHGASPRGEVRHHGEFYGACRSKCEPILKFVLQGIELMPPAHEAVQPIAEQGIKVLYDDPYLAVVDKPSGMLSVAGRRVTHSVESEVRRLFPALEGAVMVHRLDQDTSGVMVIAKSAEVHKALQRQFAMRTMTKRYIAVVDGIITSSQGEISLPLGANYDDRPRQMVDHDAGKTAHTTYQLLSVDAERGQSRIVFYPHTGRTHQLRVHASHPDGLNAPIVGDPLYGRLSRRAPRLLLHAEQIIFRHPKRDEEMNISSPAPF